MTLDEAIEQLGEVVAQDGGDADDAFDVLKDALASYRHCLRRIVNPYRRIRVPSRPAGVTDAMRLLDSETP